MQPIAPLMIEHRLIERMIKILELELEGWNDPDSVDPVFIDIAVDFIRTYADKTHHGKEEDILFRELKKKELKDKHRKVMEELIKEHVFGRKTTKELVEAKESLQKGDINAFDTIIEKIRALVSFYPQHIDKEDNSFFKEVMQYFNQDELDMMLEEGRVFDRKMIHRKYNQVVAQNEKKKDLTTQESSKWIEYM